jgi:hypothetical protein
MSQHIFLFPLSLHPTVLLTPISKPIRLNLLREIPSLQICVACRVSVRLQCSPCWALLVPSVSELLFPSSGFSCTQLYASASFSHLLLKLLQGANASVSLPVSHCDVHPLSLCQHIIRLLLSKCASSAFHQFPQISSMLNLSIIWASFRYRTRSYEGACREPLYHFLS